MVGKDSSDTFRNHGFAFMLLHIRHDSDETVRRGRMSSQWIPANLRHYWAREILCNAQRRYHGARRQSIAMNSIGDTVIALAALAIAILAATSDWLRWAL